MHSIKGIKYTKLFLPDLSPFAHRQIRLLHWSNMSFPYNLFFLLHSLPIQSSFCCPPIPASRFPWTPTWGWGHKGVTSAALWQPVLHLLEHIAGIYSFLSWPGVLWTGITMPCSHSIPELVLLTSHTSNISHSPGTNCVPWAVLFLFYQREEKTLPLPTRLEVDCPSS